MAKNKKTLKKKSKSKPGAGVSDSSPRFAAAEPIDPLYRNHKGIVTLIVIELVIIIALMTVAIFTARADRPPDPSFAVNGAGLVLQMRELRAPNLSTSSILSWVADSAAEALTMGFNDYLRRLQVSSRNFTEEGWQKFIQSLTATAQLETMLSLQQRITAVPSGPPVIAWEGFERGRYAYVVQMPVVVTYEAGSLRDDNNHMLTLRIIADDGSGNPIGLGIHDWVRN